MSYCLFSPRATYPPNSLLEEKGIAISKEAALGSQLCAGTSKVI